MIIQKALTLVRFEGKKVVFSLDDGGEMIFAKDDFPKEIQVGEQFMMKIQPQREAQLEQRELARTLLNQILANDTQATS